jgi:hypothetical protein
MLYMVPVLSVRTVLAAIGYGKGAGQRCPTVSLVAGSGSARTSRFH